MSVVYRPAATQDLAQACELVARSINDLSERHGFGQQAIVRPPDFQSFSLRDDPTGLWVAEQAGEIVGFGFSWSCGYLWFLAQLFVAPKCQGQGIGSVLLDRTLEHARTTGATTKALLTYTFNTVSTALYIRHGLYPRVPIYNVAVATERLKGFSARRERVCTALKESSSHLRRLAEIDITALGVSREKHHRFVLAETDLRGYAVEGDSGWLGYFYVAPDGQI